MSENISRDDCRRLWIVTELYYPEETSTGHHMTKIAEGLANDFQVDVICAQPNYSQKGTIAPRFETHNNVTVHRLRCTRLDKNVIPYRAINMLTFGLAVFWHALLGFRKLDKVLVVTTPPNLPFACAIVSLLRNAQYTLLIHDNYPQAFIAAGKTGPDSFLARTWRIFNRALYKYASKIIVLGRDMKELLERETKGLDVPVVCIPNWAELDLVTPSDRASSRLLKELGLVEKFVFLYAGNMGYTNDVESLMFCAERLRGRSDIHFLFLGTGAKRKWLEDQAKQNKLPNVTILDPKPRCEQPEFLNACDVAVVTLVKGMLGVSVPSRLYNALAAGKPLLGIAEENSELARVINEENVGWCVSPGDKDALLTTIEEIVNSSSLKPMAARARLIAEDQYSFDRSISAYRQLLLDC